MLLQRPFLLCAVLALPATALAGWPPSGTTEWGETETLGDGTVATFYTSTGSGPKYLGVILTADAFDDLPTEASDGTYDVTDSDGTVVWHCCGHEVKPELPSSALTDTRFEHVVLNYNPVGHPPPGVYLGFEHIDYHFYMISDAERLDIEGVTDAADMCPDTSALDPAWAAAPAPMTCDQVLDVAADLPSDQLASGHLNVGAVEPGMGNHYIDITSPEFAGEDFTHTFIYGSNAGELIFMEPMITMDYLADVRGPDCNSISMPSAFPEAGSYPTTYCMRYLPSDDAYAVYYRDFKSFPASGS